MRLKLNFLRSPHKPDRLFFDLSIYHHRNRAGVRNYRELIMTKEIQIAEVTPSERAELALRFADRKAELTVLALSSNRIIEITNPDGRGECHSARMKLKNTRVEIQAIGKAARDDATKFGKAVIAKEGELIAIIEPEEMRLGGIQDAWDEVIADAKRAVAAAEATRVRAIQSQIEEIKNLPSKLINEKAFVIADLLRLMKATTVPAGDFGEFIETARHATAATITQLEQMHADTIAHEAAQAKLVADRAELEDLRAAQKVRLAAAEQKSAEDRAAADEAARAERERLAAQARDEYAAKAGEREAQAAADRKESEEARRVQAIEADRLAADQARLQQQKDKLAADTAALRTKQAKADADAEADRLGKVTLLAAAHGVVDWFKDDADPVPCIVDLRAALANELRAAKPRVKVAA